jgi:hypothetical protein
MMEMLEVRRDGPETDTEQANGLAHVHQTRSFTSHVLGWALPLATAILLAAGLTALLLTISPLHSMQPKPVGLPPQLLPSKPWAATEWSADAPVWHNQTWPLFIGYTWGWTMLQQV